MCRCLQLFIQGPSKAFKYGWNVVKSGTRTMEGYGNTPLVGFGLIMTTLLCKTTRACFCWKKSPRDVRLSENSQEQPSYVFRSSELQNITRLSGFTHEDHTRGQKVSSYWFGMKGLIPWWGVRRCEIWNSRTVLFTNSKKYAVQKVEPWQFHFRNIDGAWPST
jgi:hypothetical protein